VAIFEVHPGWHYELMLFTGGTEPSRGAGADWMALLWKEGARDDPSLPWKARYRFRYHAGPDPWDGGDEKSVTSASAPGTTDAEKLASGLRLVGSLCALRYRAPLEEWRAAPGPEGGSSEALMAWLEAQPWSHSVRIEDTN
jgi:hypothetical protein